jgi:hypothetical protein
VAEQGSFGSAADRSGQEVVIRRQHVSPGSGIHPDGSRSVTRKP